MGALDARQRADDRQAVRCGPPDAGRPGDDALGREQGRDPFACGLEPFVRPGVGADPGRVQRQRAGT
jgi:hypothetical protein